MRGIAVSLLLVWAAGCGLEEQGSGLSVTSDAEQATTDCVVDTVEVVSDLGHPAIGFDASPDDVLAAVTGAFSGLVLTETADLEGHLTVDGAVGEVRAIRRIWTGNGPIPETCTDLYDFSIGATLQTGDASLDELFSLSLRVSPDTQAGFEILIPSDQLGGSLRPASLDTSLAVLSIEAVFVDEGWEGDLEWVDSGDRATATDSEFVGNFLFYGSGQ